MIRLRRQQNLVCVLHSLACTMIKISWGGGLLGISALFLVAPNPGLSIQNGELCWYQPYIKTASLPLSLTKHMSHTFYIFMHLADAFIQSDLHCIQVTVSTFDQLLLSLGIEPMILALLTPCSTSWATGKHTNGEFAYTGLVINFNKLIYFDISSVQGGWAGALHTS